MRVDGSSSEQHLDTIARLQTQARNQKAHSKGSNDTPRVSPAAANAASSPPAGGDASESPRGVIQLLRAGHFRGVADVRLRINFAEELQGIQAANTAATLNDGIPALQEELNAAIDAYVEAGNLSEDQITALREAQTDFNVRVGALLEGDGESATPVDDIFAELRTAFEDFLNALVPPGDDSEGTTVPAEDGVTTEALPTDNEAEPAASDAFAGLRETLSGIFEQGIGGLESSVAALGLPELSQPNGNGGAFDKFLAIYRDLYQLGDENEPAVPDAGLDAST